ncbi:hypothetical protein Tco_0370242 [Tanacetum coccineum]
MDQKQSNKKTVLKQSRNPNLYKFSMNYGDGPEFYNKNARNQFPKELSTTFSQVPATVDLLIPITPFSHLSQPFEPRGPVQGRQEEQQTPFPVLSSVRVRPRTLLLVGGFVNRPPVTSVFDCAVDFLVISNTEIKKIVQDSNRRRHEHHGKKRNIKYAEQEESQMQQTTLGCEGRGCDWRGCPTEGGEESRMVVEAYSWGDGGECGWILDGRVVSGSDL